ncbi:Metaxin-2 [Drechslerella dactyloides]|uniref:Metaxin-2 n=1 Tax=Drechslerella dactyloides TaxID=74499 RepID=A0AAD6NF82_DREDA|nr:Metaxin-2 [Drechslerella dactyloides]
MSEIPELEELYVYEMPGKEMVYTFLSSSLLENISNSNRGTLRQAEREERRKTVERRTRQRQASLDACWRQKYTHVIREISWLSHLEQMRKHARPIDAHTARTFGIPAAWRAGAGPAAGFATPTTIRPVAQVITSAYDNDVLMTGVDAEIPIIRKLKCGNPPHFLENERPTPPASPKPSPRPPRSPNPTVVVHAFEKASGTPTVSPFCQKLECHLRFAGVQYTEKDALPHKAPKKKLPYITINDTTVSDSGFIVRYLKEHKIVDLDGAAGLTDLQKAESLAYRGFWEEGIYHAIVSYRWSRKENVPIISNELFGKLPVVIRGSFSWWFGRSLNKTLTMQGIGRHTPAEVDTILREAFAALETRLTTASGKAEWFHHTAAPTDIDAVLAGMLINVCGTRSNALPKDIVLKSVVLRGYLKMVVEQYFPEFAGLLTEIREVEAQHPVAANPPVL